ncbi:MAG: hypothetical protein JSV03_10750, partial [Planctomycetota bacterium]
DIQAIDRRRNSAPMTHGKSASYMPVPSENSAIAPVNPNSFILISPGYDGIFGTDDDINNFKNPM